MKFVDFAVVAFLGVMIITVFMVQIFPLLRRRTKTWISLPGRGDKACVVLGAKDIEELSRIIEQASVEAKTWASRGGSLREFATACREKARRDD
jgi:hypothetical protein